MLPFARFVTISKVQFFGLFLFLSFSCYFILLEKAESVKRSKSKPKSEDEAHATADSSEVAGVDEQVKPVANFPAPSADSQVSIPLPCILLCCLLMSCIL